MRVYRLTPIAALLLIPSFAAAEVLQFPAGANLDARQTEALGSVRLPVAAWQDGAVESIVLAGVVDRQAWQIPASDLTTLQLVSPLRSQLEAAGFEVVFACRSAVCGGFEFRYAMDLLREPAMFVDLGDFRYLLARRETGDGPEYVALMASRTTGRGFVHLTRVGPESSSQVFPLPPDAVLTTDKPSPTPRASDANPVAPAPISRAPSSESNLATRLESDGHAVLVDLSFQIGSSQLAGNAFASLDALAAWLQEHPEARIVLVGHTDAQGSLAANIELSRKRAAAVLETLVKSHGIARTRLAAEGVGYLAPLASNATEEGRTVNRRVEAILLGGG